MARKLIITIDGDGFIYRSNFDDRPVGELIFERLLTQFPFRFSASFIAGEHDLYSKYFDVDLARRILALSNVDAASHSWSHPHDWTTGVNLEQEINRSVDYINSELLPAGKSVETFLWTGLCNPLPAAVERTRMLNISNLNGGCPTVPWTEKGGVRQFHARAPSDWELMNLKALISESPIKQVYKFLQAYNGKTSGFRKVTDYFEANPALPVHVYFHWYSGVRAESLDALISVLEWCASQDLESVSVRDYIADLQATDRR